MDCKRKGRSVVASNELKNELTKHFGKELSATNSTSLDSNDFEDLGIKLSGLSSSSSLSWSEDYDSEISKKVQQELVRLDTIFQGSETELSPYDATEIAEWKHYFPNIYILGRITPTNSPENSSGPDSETELNVKTTKSRKKRSALSNNQRRLTAYDVLNPNQTNYNSLPHNLKNLELAQYLRISSIKNPGKRRNLQMRKQASRDSLGDEITPEYSSLPCITTVPLQVAPNQKKIGKSDPSRQVTLPPIQNSFRSISATPRQPSSRTIFESVNCYERKFSQKASSQTAKLKSELMMLFDHIPISHR